MQWVHAVVAELNDDYYYCHLIFDVISLDIGRRIIEEAATATFILVLSPFFACLATCYLLLSVSFNFFHVKVLFAVIYSLNLSIATKTLS
jgi:hypothetical protein